MIVIVIDASALAAYVLREEAWENIEQSLRETPISVELLPLETANAVVMARRSRRLTTSEAANALQLVRRLAETSISLVRHARLLDDASLVAEQHGLTIYDAVYLAMARREQAAIATRDQSQIRVAREMRIKVVE